MIEQNKSETIENKYNLFSPNKVIWASRLNFSSKKPKKEIKLIFHHPNLLFLNSKKVKSREDASREVGENIMRQIKAKSKCLAKSGTNFRSCTSYQAENSRITPFKSSGSNTPLPVRSHTEEGLEVCGKSSCLTNELIRNPTPNLHRDKPNMTGGYFHATRTTNDENVFKAMEGKQGRQKKQAWSQLILDKAKRHAVRLDMYFSAEKKYLKYVSRCR